MNCQALPCARQRGPRVPGWARQAAPLCKPEFILGASPHSLKMRRLLSHRHGRTHGRADRDFHQ